MCKQLIIFLNSLSTDQQQTYAANCGTTVGYLRKACSIGQTFGPELCTRLDLNSHGAVSRQELRPKDWHEIWPELARKRARVAR